MSADASDTKDKSVTDNDYCVFFKYFNDGRLREAAITLENLAKIEDSGEKYLNARRYLGMVYFEMEEFKKAIEELSKISNLEGASSKFRTLTKTKCDYSFDEEETPEGHLAWVYHDLGMAYLGEDNYEIAEKWLQKAFEKAEKEIFRNDLGWLYYKWNRPKEAIDKFEISIYKGDNSGFPHFYLGLALIKTGTLLRAKEQLNEAIRKFDARARDPKASKSKHIFYELMKASTLNNLGRIEMDNGEYRKAKKLFLEGLAICQKQECQEHIETLSPRAKTKENRTIAALHNNLGRLHYKQGLLDEAKKEYMNALKFEELPEIYNNLAVAYHEEGASEKAESYLKNALRLDPQAEAAKANLNRLIGVGTNWWDWWFKSGTSRSRGIVGFALVFALLVMVGNMMCTSFSGSEISVLGVSILSFGAEEVNTIQEDINRSVINGTPQITITNSTKTTTTDNRQSLINMILITALIFFLLVHPQVKIFSLGEAKFEMETASVSGSTLSCEGVPSS
ncbi:tetratricopeptide repeat protein [Candidatus Methanocrinis natronophilus]|uniref:Tetratricopeptide repeat protein n=1 Tax=Candidatus Methanocrinis natronophilus TaxID=3033396 RepID=A0ABT5X4Z8_9EURY|nr:tetratricopeptide repeat protein [Candidatus Methanocrinis natronophilus]MDF0589772.1 tetratricopeptide repeat protein [Candidatus Methanocrinis natronophilus]